MGVWISGTKSKWASLCNCVYRRNMLKVLPSPLGHTPVPHCKASSKNAAVAWQDNFTQVSPSSRLIELVVEFHISGVTCCQQSGVCFHFSLMPPVKTPWCQLWEHPIQTYLQRSWLWQIRVRVFARNVNFNYNIIHWRSFLFQVASCFNA